MFNKYRVYSFIMFILISYLGWFYLIQPEIESRKIENINKKYNTISLGLDLVGGSQLTYSADISKIKKEDISEVMKSLKQTLTNRLNSFGTSEVSIVIEKTSIFASGSDIKRSLIIEIPGISDLDEAKKLIGKIPLLEFKVKIDGKYKDIGLTGRDLKSAGLTTDQVGKPAVLIKFNEDGTKLFADLTEKHIGKQMGIFVDGYPISEPVLRASIRNGISVIEGNFSLAEAQELIRDLKFGALPVQISLESSTTISPSLGEMVLNSGVRASFLGFLLVILFLLVVYRASGLGASVALIFYVILTLSLFKVFGFVFTAAGIAGFIISIGFAVDANVLIFERIREELFKGQKIKDAIKIGFNRAWLSIRDGNLSSIFTAIILFYMTGSLVQGFALTFGFGVIISMFSALVLTRTFLFALIGTSNKQNVKKVFIGNFKPFNNIKK